MAAKNPDKYKTIKDNLKLIERLAKHGFSDSEIAEFLAVELTLLNEYKKRHPKFGLALKKAMLIADMEVEESLLKRAKGFECTEEYIVYLPAGDDDTEDFKIKEVKKIKKFVPPDVSSAIAWLNNRKPERWSKNPGIVNELNSSELSRLRKIASREAEENI